MSHIEWSAYEGDDEPAEPSGYGRLIALCLLSLCALFALVVVGMRIDGVTLWERYATPAKTVNASASCFDGLYLGVPVGRAVRLRPDLALSPVTGGELAGTYEAAGVRHIVAFLDGEHGRKAYRFRTLRRVDRAGERAYVDALVAVHGKPVSSGCSNPVYAPGRICRNTWVIDGGISVEIVGRAVSAPNGGEIVELTATFVDLYLEGLKRHAAGAIS